MHLLALYIFLYKNIILQELWFKQHIHDLNILYNDSEHVFCLILPMQYSLRQGGCVNGIIVWETCTGMLQWYMNVLFMINSGFISANHCFCRIINRIGSPTWITCSIGSSLFERGLWMSLFNLRDWKMSYKYFYPHISCNIGLIGGHGIHVIVG